MKDLYFITFYMQNGVTKFMRKRTRVPLQSFCFSNSILFLSRALFLMTGMFHKGKFSEDEKECEDLLNYRCHSKAQSSIQHIMRTLTFNVIHRFSNIHNYCSHYLSAKINLIPSMKSYIRPLEEYADSHFTLRAIWNQTSSKN